MFWTFLIVVVVFVLFRFFMSLNQDNEDLQGKTLAEKFDVVVNMLNQAAFNGAGSVTTLDKREFNLYEDGQNQIIKFHYSSGHLTLTWRYKYFQKEIVHERQFDNVRNISLFDQQKIGQQMINEMEVVVQRHKNDVLGGI
ncbi:hypothetical protein F5984_06745 [Rudanella paleaurantiibacter]|uniref:Uncharacterized protein n=1 Tax=Rudanella paleaurantiibacter TaxID=2614655 RepID=A0A7J5U2A2_9BACT|nr:hypothetical protein [Rudanella paleaurantiibacter]KAB7731914.1 hypothetical protein F5984_06745 [Rudanella paleaurantiibacter]